MVVSKDIDLVDGTVAVRPFLELFIAVETWYAPESADEW